MYNYRVVISQRRGFAKFKTTKTKLRRIRQKRRNLKKNESYPLKNDL